MSDRYSRTEMIIGSEAVDKIKAASVIVFGIGGVGSYVVEGLARAGVGKLVLVDNDVVDITNINRQLPALHSTIGKPKAK
ncbi:MAG: ThiF family adenylyltransferase, partial [Firmicutes bacterium]|nr:ThiF family adenylyltransferase [Bacillota bacterium]